MARLDQVASDDIRAIAGIEVKYDLMANLLQCDRLRALRLLRGDPDATALAQDAACAANATGRAYAKRLQSSAFD